jgi:hypothetical protein
MNRDFLANLDLGTKEKRRKKNEKSQEQKNSCVSNE